MAILSPTAISGTVAWLGLVRERKAGLASSAVESVVATYEGFTGESHAGLTRSSCTRTLKQFPVGTEIRNSRQISIVSSEELAIIAEGMEIPVLEPMWVGANLVFEGIPDLTDLPPSSRLIFENGTSLVVDMENSPCRHPADLIETFHPGHGKKFAKHALGRRGLVGWVERGGSIALGDKAIVHTVQQRLYKPLAKQWA
jgi:MOSC domain-containing protein YiiM